MSYNLLLDSQFKTGLNWKFNNCRYENGKLISNSKVFGIEQELILPDPTKLYFRVQYKSLSPYIKDVKIGIQNGSTLNIDNKVPKYNKKQSVSVIDIAKQEKIKLHIIFESFKEENEVIIENPILVDLVYLNKSKWLKLILDRTVHYMPGYMYKNEYSISEIKPDAEDFKDLNMSNGKIGSIITLKETKEIPITAKFINNNYYLAKLDLEEINKFGDIYFKYGVIKSTKLNDQLYILFKANDKYNLTLTVEPNDVLDYKINLKHILLVNITKLNLLKADIPYLPFIGD